MGGASWVTLYDGAKLPNNSIVVQNYRFDLPGGWQSGYIWALDVYKNSDLYVSQYVLFCHMTNYITTSDAPIDFVNMTTGSNYFTATVVTRIANVKRIRIQLFNGNE